MSRVIQVIYKPYNPQDTQPKQLVRLTIASDRITIKFPYGFDGDKEAIIDCAQDIAEQIPEDSVTLRGYFRPGKDYIVLSKNNGESGGSFGRPKS